MRQTPFNFTTNPSATTDKVSSLSDLTSRPAVSLLDRFKKNTAQPAPEPEKTESTTTEQAEDKTPGAPGAAQSSATFEEDFEGFKETAGKKLNDFVENPEDFAKMIVRFGNVGRSIFLPGLYERAMFTATEKQDLPGILEKSYANEKKPNTKADEGFNTFEKRVYQKWIKLEDAKSKISYTEEEIVWLAKIIAKRIKDVTVAVWLEKYDWLIALLYLEFKHAQVIVAVKAEDFFIGRFKQAA